MEELKERIWVNEILDYINKKDYRTAIKWCQQKGVILYKDGVNRFALKEDFIKAYNTMNESAILAPVSNGTERRYKPKGSVARATKMKYNE